MTAILSPTRRARRSVAVLPLAAALFLTPAWGGDGAPARPAPAAELATASVTSEGGAGRSAYDGVVEAVRQTVIAAQVPGAVRGAGRQGRRPRCGPARCCCAWMHAPPNRRAAAERRAGARRPCRLEEASPELRPPAAALREELHQPGRARPRRGAVTRRPRPKPPPCWPRRGRAHAVRLLRGQRALRRRGRRRAGGAGRHGDAGPSAADAVRPGARCASASRVPQIVAARRLRPKPASRSCPARRAASRRRARNVLPTVDPATHTLELRLDLPAGLAGVDARHVRPRLAAGGGTAPTRGCLCPPAPCCAAPN